MGCSVVIPGQVPAPLAQVSLCDYEHLEHRDWAQQMPFLGPTPGAQETGSGVVGEERMLVGATHGDAHIL